MDKTYRIKNLIKREPLKRGRCHPLGFPPIQNPFHFNFFADFLFEINFILTANRSHLFSLRNCDPPSDTKKPRKQLEGGKRENRFLFDFFFFIEILRQIPIVFIHLFSDTSNTHLEVGKSSREMYFCFFLFFRFHKRHRNCLFSYSLISAFSLVVADHLQDVKWQPSLKKAFYYYIFFFSFTGRTSREMT